MAKKFNPDDVERWVTVKGARIPIMKDGSFGVGEMTVNLKDGKTRKVAITKEEAENLSTSKGRSPKGQYANTVKSAKEYKKEAQSRNARYDTSRATTNKGKKTQMSSEERLTQELAPVAKKLRSGYVSSYNKFFEAYLKAKGISHKELTDMSPRGQLELKKYSNDWFDKLKKKK